jgi:hypothetical protein
MRAQIDASAQLRRLTAADAPDYRALMLDGYARQPDAFTAEPAERAALPLSFWEARLAPGADAAEIVFGVFLDGRLAGALGLSFMQRPKLRHKANLFGMYVTLTPFFLARTEVRGSRTARTQTGSE